VGPFEVDVLVRLVFKQGWRTLASKTPSCPSEIPKGVKPYEISLSEPLGQAASLNGPPSNLIISFAHPHE
jgi:hypothetical protein